MFSLKSHTIYKKENHPKLAKSAAMGFFQGTQERVQNSRGNRAISVRAIEALLDLVCGTLYQLTFSTIKTIIDKLYIFSAGPFYKLSMNTI